MQTLTGISSLIQLFVLVRQIPLRVSVKIAVLIKLANSNSATSVSHNNLYFLANIIKIAKYFEIAISITLFQAVVHGYIWWRW